MFLEKCRRIKNHPPHKGSGYRDRNFKDSSDVIGASLPITFFTRPLIPHAVADTSLPTDAELCSRSRDSFLHRSEDFAP